MGWFTPWYLIQVYAFGVAVFYVWAWAHGSSLYDEDYFDHARQLGFDDPRVVQLFVTFFWPLPLAATMVLIVIVMGSTMAVFLVSVGVALTYYAYRVLRVLVILLYMALSRLAWTLPPVGSLEVADDCE